MKHIITSVLLLLTLSAFAERVEPYSGTRLFWDPATRKTVFNSGGYSRMIKLQDGRLMAVAEQGGHIVVSYSRDNGNIWSDAERIAFPHDNINLCVPDLIQMSDGTIVVGYNPRPNTPYTPDRLFGIRCKRSTDNGASWSDEIFIADATQDFYNGMWEPSFLELPSGELQVYFADEEPYPSVGYGEQQISLSRSFDKGQTWGEKQKISFRSGSRDGMPVPILLADKSEIVVIIEDNGWPGYGDFFPTTVRCSLEKNWGDNYFVDGSSNDRHKTLDFNYAPVVKGGAPYLRQLANGATVISWQSSYNSNNVLKMWTAVGDSRAMNFKALSTPFVTEPSQSIAWNSVAAIDTFVVAVGGVAGRVEMIKGFPKTQFDAAYGTPRVDGKITRNEGYTSSNATQFKLGTQTGTTTTCDFAYSRDSLYFICRVSDKDQITSGANQDAVTLCIDAHGTSDNKPAAGTFRYMIRLAGDVLRYAGNGSNWKLMNTTGYHCVCSKSSTSYTIELAVAWSDLDLSSAPTEGISVNIIVENGSISGKVTETIPDADKSKPFTWMPLHLKNVETGIHTKKADANIVKIIVNNGTLDISSVANINNVAIFSLDGKCVRNYSGVGNSLSAPVPFSGVAVVVVRLADGSVVRKKIVL